MWLDVTAPRANRPTLDHDLTWRTCIAYVSHSPLARGDIITTGGSPRRRHRHEAADSQRWRRSPARHRGGTGRAPLRPSSRVMIHWLSCRLVPASTFEAFTKNGRDWRDRARRHAGSQPFSNGTFMKLIFLQSSPFVRTVRLAAIETRPVDKSRILRRRSSGPAANDRLCAQSRRRKHCGGSSQLAPSIPGFIGIVGYLDELAGGGKTDPDTGPTRWQVRPTIRCCSACLLRCCCCRYEPGVRARLTWGMLERRSCESCWQGMARSTSGRRVFVFTCCRGSAPTS